MAPTSTFDASQSLQNGLKKLEERENYRRIQISLQFAVNSHIPYETFTLANLLAIVYGQHQTAHASQFDVYGSPLTTNWPNLQDSDSERPDYNTQLIPIRNSQF